MDPDWIFKLVLSFSWVEYLWEAYLSKRQRVIYVEKVRPPKELSGIVSDGDYESARTYALDRSIFGSYQALFSQILSTLIVCSNGFKLVWDVCSVENEIWTSLLYIFVFNVIQVVIGVPWTVYETFVLEEKHGFNKQTPVFFIKDQMKKFLLSQVIMMPLIAAIIKIIQYGGDYFFIYLWLFTLCFVLVMMIIYPEFIAPLFDKYIPLPDGELRTKIEELASSVQFPLYKLFVVEGSKRSSHSNAYFYGFFNFKRIVLFDTLLEESERKKVKELTGSDDKPESEEDAAKGCGTSEILAVLAHELGHWKLNHVFKNIVIAQIQILAMFALFKHLYQDQNLYAAFGFIDQRPIIIGLMIIFQMITAPVNAILSFLMTVLTRRFEFQADDFAASMGKSKELKSALIKLNKDNKGFPLFDPLYSAWHHSHPPILERIKVLDAGKRD
ncbi:CAAX prenyl protease 1 homolog [Lepeophtheirus salmonis]|uniref:CAAX prenyl protease 1 homolog n=1 Tax=Lepeophtheirus salmonis TaxID=72036 RepID=UPI001AE554CD|nr:CAAX prenyl protease 1 homolog [Lepeophtheirus salmonis]